MFSVLCDSSIIHGAEHIKAASKRPHLNVMNVKIMMHQRKFVSTCKFLATERFKFFFISFHFLQSLICEGEKKVLKGFMRVCFLNICGALVTHVLKVKSCNKTALVILQPFAISFCFR